MGYQAESAIWRNYLLTGAQELREGKPEIRDTSPPAATSPSTCRSTWSSTRWAPGSTGRGPKGKRIVINWEFTDLGRRWVMTIENSALTTVEGRHDDDADATITLTAIGARLADPRWPGRRRRST